MCRLYDAKSLAVRFPHAFAGLSVVLLPGLSNWGADTWVLRALYEIDRRYVTTR